MRLKQFFPFHLIDSMGTLEETQEAISLELRYQSSLDLSESTYSAIRHLPLSRDLAQHARQQLVSRLDDACQKHPHLFQRVSVGSAGRGQRVSRQHVPCVGLSCGQSCVHQPLLLTTTRGASSTIFSAGHRHHHCRDHAGAARERHGRARGLRVRHAHL